VNSLNGDGGGDENGEDCDTTLPDTPAGDDNCLPSRNDIRRLITAREHRVTTAWILPTAAIPRVGIFEDYQYDPINGVSALMNSDYAVKSLSGD
jgi:hypothetical protein